MTAFSVSVAVAACGSELAGEATVAAMTRTVKISAHRIVSPYPAGH